MELFVFEIHKIRLPTIKNSGDKKEPYATHRKTLLKCSSEQYFTCIVDFLLWCPLKGVGNPSNK